MLGSAAGLVVEPAELTLEDDEAASSSVSLSVNPASVSEDAGATVVTVTAALDGAVRPEATPVTVSVGAAGDAAALGTDYQAVSDFVLMIAPEALSGEASFTLTPEDDGVAEGDEAITVLGAAAGLTVDLAELTLEDDDTASSSVSLSVHPGSVSEDAGPTVFAVTAALDGAARPAATAVTVSVGAPGDTAASGTDYEAVPEITVTIPGGNVSAETAFTVVPKDDVWAEGTETITVLGEAAGLAVDSAALTLEDNDEPSTAVRLSLQTNFAWEGGGSRVIGLTAELGRRGPFRADGGDSVGGRRGRHGGVGDRLPGGPGPHSDDPGGGSECAGFLPADADGRTRSPKERRRSRCRGRRPGWPWSRSNCYLPTMTCLPRRWSCRWTRGRCRRLRGPRW